MVSHRLSSKQIKNIRLYTEDGFTYGFTYTEVVK